MSSILNGLHDEMTAVMKVARGASQEPEANGHCSDGAEDIVEEADSAAKEDDGWEQVGPKNKSVITRSVVSEVLASSPLALRSDRACQIFVQITVYRY